MKKFLLILILAISFTGCGSDSADENIGPPVIEKLSVYRADGEPVYYQDNQLLSSNHVIRFDSNFRADTNVKYSYRTDLSVAYKDFSALDISGMSGDISVRVLAKNSYGSDHAFFTFIIVNYDPQGDGNEDNIDIDDFDYDGSYEFNNEENNDIDVFYYNDSHESNNNNGIELYDCTWEPGTGTNGSGSGMAGSDPYATERQEYYGDDER